MACFLVAYDLKEVGQNYPSITSKLGSLTNCHAQGSVWFVEWSGTATALRDFLAPCLDANDRLFVDEVSLSWAGWNMPTCGKWLNDRGR